MSKMPRPFQVKVSLITLASARALAFAGRLPDPIAQPDRNTAPM